MQDACLVDGEQHTPFNFKWLEKSTKRREISDGVLKSLALWYPKELLALMEDEHSWLGADIEWFKELPPGPLGQAVGAAVGSQFEIASQFVILARRHGAVEQLVESAVKEGNANPELLLLAAAESDTKVQWDGKAVDICRALVEHHGALGLEPPAGDDSNRTAKQVGTSSKDPETRAFFQKLGEMSCLRRVTIFGSLICCPLPLPLPLMRGSAGLGRSECVY